MTKKKNIFTKIKKEEKGEDSTTIWTQNVTYIFSKYFSETLKIR